jgi:5'(3')-deoxyribonucleotidase
MNRYNLPVVVFDCDDVLTDLKSVILENISEALGRKVEEHELTDFDLRNVFGEECDVEHIFGAVDLKSLKPRDHQACGIPKLAAMYGHYVVILTARQGHDPKGIITRNWLINNDVYFDELILVPMDVPKSETIATLGDVKLYIDDNMHHVEQSAALPNVQKVLLQNQPWNVTSQHPDRVEFSLEIIPYLEG